MNHKLYVQLRLIFNKKQKKKEYRKNIVNKQMMSEFRAKAYAYAKLLFSNAPVLAVM